MMLVNVRLLLLRW